MVFGVARRFTQNFRKARRFTQIFPKAVRIMGIMGLDLDVHIVHCVHTVNVVQLSQLPPFSLLTPNFSLLTHTTPM